MRATEPLALHHSWPLLERKRRFELGTILDWAVQMPIDPSGFGDCGRMLADRGIGLWECDLDDGALTWTEGVYDLFGLPRGAAVRRDEAVSFYADESGAAMERLRAYALRHRRGFTLDAEIRPAGAASRWMRLIAAPVCRNGRAVRLQGLKIAI